nr:MAG TPA: hypothetical protein [Caudoviricetes sp.]
MEHSNKDEFYSYYNKSPPGLGWTLFFFFRVQYVGTLPTRAL